MRGGWVRKERKIKIKREKKSFISKGSSNITTNNKHNTRNLHFLFVSWGKGGKKRERERERGLTFIFKMSQRQKHISCLLWSSYWNHSSFCSGDGIRTKYGFSYKSRPYFVHDTCEINFLWFYPFQCVKKMWLYIIVWD